MKQYFVMRYRKKRKDWKICTDNNEQFLSSFAAQRMLHVLSKKYPKTLYKLGVQV